jgi:hypothetical protein
MRVRDQIKDPNPIPLPQRLTVRVKEVRDYTGWGRNTIYEKLKSGELKRAKSDPRSITVKSLLAATEAA